MSERTGTVDHYGANYQQFASELYAEIRTEAFGEDIGQNGWLTVDEQDIFIAWLQLSAGRRLLDVACGSGGPTLRIARVTGCHVHGIDIHKDAVATAHAQAQESGLNDRAKFEQADASQRLELPGSSVDGIICIDAINHLPDRAGILAEWARVLRPGGRLVFTDPIVVTGALTHEEIAIRSSVGFFLFVPPGTDEQFIESAGLQLVSREDRTENMAEMAERWCTARAARAAALRRIEGPETFEGQQRFFEVAARLAAERRLSRFAFCAERPAAYE